MRGLFLKEKPLRHHDPYSFVGSGRDDREALIRMMVQHWREMTSDQSRFLVDYAEIEKIADYLIGHYQSRCVKSYFRFTYLKWVRTWRFRQDLILHLQSAIDQDMEMLLDE